MGFLKIKKIIKIDDAVFLYLFSDGMDCCESGAGYYRFYSVI